MLQSSTVAEQDGTLCVSLLTRYYESRHLHEVTEEIPRKRVFLVSDIGSFLQATTTTKKKKLSRMV